MIGTKVREKREKASISGYRLAKTIGVSASTLSNIETGVSKNPSWYTICKVADVLNVSLDELREENEEGQIWVK